MTILIVGTNEIISKSIYDILNVLTQVFLARF